MADSKIDASTHTVDFIKGDWDKAVLLGNPHIDNLMTALLGLGAEHWALRRRFMVVEKLLDEKKVVDHGTIESYVPSEQEKIAWDAQRDEFINRVYSVLTRETGQISSNIPTARTAPLDKP